VLGGGSAGLGLSENGVCGFLRGSVLMNAPSEWRLTWER